MLITSSDLRSAAYGIGHAYGCTVHGCGIWFLVGVDVFTRGTVCQVVKRGINGLLGNCKSGS